MASTHGDVFKQVLLMNHTLYFESPLLGDIFQHVCAERSHIGYYDLPDADITGILDFARANRKNHIVVVGIGGSSLGAKAIYTFLKAYNHRPLKKLHFLESTDPVVLRNRIDEIDLDDALFLIISKSGGTIETIGIFKYLLSLVSVSSGSYAVITDPGSPLESFALMHELSLFHIPGNVGGRFSVLSPAGLVPLALAGIDIRLLLQGARDVKNEFFSQGKIYATLLEKASFYALNYLRNNINAIFSYSETLRHFNEWYVQLWGESLGKHQRHSFLSIGLTPIGLIGPTDQHSFLQLIVEGPRDKTVTFIKIRDFKDESVIPDTSLPKLEAMDILNGYTFAELINLQADSIIEQLQSLKLPLDVIELEQADESNIGALMYTYELLTSMVAAMLDIDAYDQPGVEGGKTILKQKLVK